VENDKLKERLTQLEGQVYRLLVALCCALSVMLVIIFYNRQPYVLNEGVGDAFLRMVAIITSSFVVGWPIVRWVVGKKTE
jgi:hypothetical protein